MKKLSASVERELCDLRMQVQGASDAYNAAIKAQAKKIECEPGVLKKYINCKLAGDLHPLRVEAEQLEALAEGAA